MKLSSIDEVKRLAELRQDLARRVVELPKMMGVTIRGTYQDDVVVAAARPAVEAELVARIIRIDVQLKAMGVEIDADV